jgi:hypothetical protein
VAEFDLHTYYASFNRKAMPEGALQALSRASSHLPKEHVGYKVWMTCVAGPRLFYDDLAAWSVTLGETISRLKPRLRFRSRTYVPSYKPDWGRVAALDGLHYVIDGTAPKVTPRAEELGCDREAYLRIRNFVAGALLLAMQQYETELRVVVAVERMA